MAKKTLAKNVATPQYIIATLQHSVAISHYIVAAWCPNQCIRLWHLIIELSFYTRQQQPNQMGIGGSKMYAVVAAL